MRNIRRRLMITEAAHQKWLNTPIDFEDAEVKRICVENFGGESGITNKRYGTVGVAGMAGELTRRQAAEVSYFGDLFRDNPAIVKFNEFRYFTGYFSGSIIKRQAFCKGSVNLTEITTPPTTRVLSYYWLFQDAVPNALTKVTLNEGLESIQYIFLDKATSLRKLVLPSSLREINSGSMTYYGLKLSVLVFKSAVPPVNTQPPNRISVDMYVPDESVGLYKAADGYRADKVHPMSEYQE